MSYRYLFLIAAFLLLLSVVLAEVYPALSGRSSLLAYLSVALGWATTSIMNK